MADPIASSCGTTGRRQPLLRLPHLDDFVTRTDVAFAEHAEVEPGPTAAGQQCGHARLIHPNAHAIARHARLRDLKQRTADLIAVSDTGGVVGKSLHGEVLTELAVHEFVPFQPLPPMAVRLELVDEHRAMLAAVPSQIPLTIAFEIQPPDSTPAAHRTLPDPGVHQVAVPLNVSREADVDRNQSRHSASHDVNYHRQRRRRVSASDTLSVTT